MNIADLAARRPDGRAFALVDLESGADAETVRAASLVTRESGGVVIGVASKPVEPALGQLTSVLAFSLTNEEAAAREDVILVPALDDAISSLEQTVASFPNASATLIDVLWLSEGRDVFDGLTAESLAYSMLLAGPEFARWLRERPAATERKDDGDPVLMERKDNTLRIKLNRPQKHNAYSRAVRDGLVEAIGLAVFDPSITRVELSGNGPSFCSGGDLQEFGTAPDPATAHLIRMRQSVATLIHRCADRMTVRVHGACIGAGVELPSFASHIVAARDAFFSLPEISMGLIPGAGGTVGLPRRIGRWRTAYLALTGHRLEAEQALDWGLVDALEES